jgi:hypothetical protein
VALFRRATWARSADAGRRRETPEDIVVATRPASWSNTEQAQALQPPTPTAYFQFGVLRFQPWNWNNPNRSTKLLALMLYAGNTGHWH